MKSNTWNAYWLVVFFSCTATTIFGQLRNQDSLRIQEITSNIGSISYSDTDSALTLVDTAIMLSERHDFEKSRTALLINKGILFKIQGSYDSSAYYYFRGLEMAVRMRDTTNMVRAHMNTALVYELQQRYGLALQTYRKAELLLKPTDSLGYAKLYNNLGILYKKSGDVDKGLAYYQQSAELNQAIRNKRDLALNYNNMAIIYRDRKEYDKALTDFRKALKINEEIDSKVAIASNHINVGALYGMQGSFALALAESEMAYQLASTISARKEMKDALFNIQYAYAAMGNYKLAYETTERYHRLNDSLLDERTTAAIAELDKKYNKAKQEQTIAVLEKDGLLQAAVLDRQRNTLIWVSVALALMAIFSVVIYRNLLKNKRLSQALVLKNAKIETLIRELHHRVKNNMQVISSLLSLQSMKIDDQLAKEAVREGQHRVEAMGLIHHKLYQHEDITSVDMREYIEGLVYNLMDSYGGGPVDVKLDVVDIHLDIDTAIPLGLIVNELATNAFKYGLCDSTAPSLEIALTKDTDQLWLRVTDNGLGFPEDFDIEHASSFGLKLVHTLVKQLDGSLTVSGTNGTQFALSVPWMPGRLVA